MKIYFIEIRFDINNPTVRMTVFLAFFTEIFRCISVNNRFYDCFTLNLDSFSKCLTDSNNYFFSSFVSYFNSSNICVSQSHFKALTVSQERNEKNISQRKKFKKRFSQRIFFVNAQK